MTITTNEIKSFMDNTNVDMFKGSTRLAVDKRGRVENTKKIEYMLFLIKNLSGHWQDLKNSKMKCLSCGLRVLDLMNRI